MVQVLVPNCFILMKSEKLSSYGPKTLILTNFTNSVRKCFFTLTFFIFQFHKKKKIKKNGTVTLTWIWPFISYFSTLMNFIFEKIPIFTGLGVTIKRPTRQLVINNIYICGTKIINEITNIFCFFNYLCIIYLCRGKFLLIYLNFLFPYLDVFW